MDNITDGTAAPFGIHNICFEGKKSDIRPGQWYGPHMISIVLKNICNQHPNKIPGFKMHVCVDSNIFLDEIEDLIVNKNLSVVFSSNSLRSQLLAVKNGVGLGLLHSFIAKKENGLLAILPEIINIKREYWIVIHENLSNLRRIKAVTNFLTTILKNEKKNLYEL